MASYAVTMAMSILCIYIHGLSIVPLYSCIRCVPRLPVLTEFPTSKEKMQVIGHFDRMRCIFSLFCINWRSWNAGDTREMWLIWSLYFPIYIVAAQTWNADTLYTSILMYYSSLLYVWPFHHLWLLLLDPPCMERWTIFCKPTKMPHPCPT